jgi:hypothetical protein
VSVAKAAARKECSSCGITFDRVFTCEGCDQAHYCSKECQSAHWQKRQRVCRGAARAGQAARGSRKKRGEGSQASEAAEALGLVTAKGAVLVAASRTGSRWGWRHMALLVALCAVLIRLWS